MDTSNNAGTNVTAEEAERLQKATTKVNANRYTVLSNRDDVICNGVAGPPEKSDEELGLTVTPRKTNSKRKVIQDKSDDEEFEFEDKVVVAENPKKMHQ